MSNNAFFKEGISQAFSQALAEQPEFIRRKDSIREVTGTVLHIANIFVGFAVAELPIWATAVIAAIIGIVQVVHAATTEAPLAPSQERKILEKIDRADLPELNGPHGDIMVTLTSIFEAINNYRERERAENPYGKGALDENLSPDQGDLPVNVETPAQPEAPKVKNPPALLDALRQRVAENVGRHRLG